MGLEISVLDAGAEWREIEEVRRVYGAGQLEDRRGQDG